MTAGTRWDKCAVAEGEPLRVRFHPRSGESWTGAFTPGEGGASGVFEHPDRRSAVVVSMGAAYVVDVDRAHVDALGSAIDTVLELPSRRLLVLSDGARLIFVGSDGVRSTRLLSRGGIRRVDSYGNEIHGEAWDPDEEAWHAFRVDLDTLEVSGGSYTPEP